MTDDKLSHTRHCISAGDGGKAGGPHRSFYADKLYLD